MPTDNLRVVFDVPEEGKKIVKMESVTSKALTNASRLTLDEIETKFSKAGWIDHL